MLHRIIEHDESCCDLYRHASSYNSPLQLSGGGGGFIKSKVIFVFDIFKMVTFHQKVLASEESEVTASHFVGYSF